MGCHLLCECKFNIELNYKGYAKEYLDLMDTHSILDFLQKGNYPCCDYFLDVTEELLDVSNIVPTVKQMCKIWGAFNKALMEDPNPCPLDVVTELKMMEFIQRLISEQ